MGAGLDGLGPLLPTHLAHADNANHGLLDLCACRPHLKRGLHNNGPALARLGRDGDGVRGDCHAVKARLLPPARGLV